MSVVGDHRLSFSVFYLAHDPESALQYHTTGRLTLALGPTGAARLELHSDTVLHQSEGLASIDEIQRVRAGWRGDAVLTDDGARVLLRLESARCTVAPDDAPSRETPIACRGLEPAAPALIDLHCTSASVAITTAGLTSAGPRAPALRCALARPPLALRDLLVDDALYFPREAGLTLRRTDEGLAGSLTFARDT